MQVDLFTITIDINVCIFLFLFCCIIVIRFHCPKDKKSKHTRNAQTCHKGTLIFSQVEIPQRVVEFLFFVILIINQDLDQE